MGCPEADLPAEEGGVVATGVSCSSKDTGVSCTEAGRPSAGVTSTADGRPRRADEGGLGERGVSWTEEGRPKMDSRTEEPPPGLSRMLASEAAGWGREAEACGSCSNSIACDGAWPGAWLPQNPCASLVHAAQAPTRTHPDGTGRPATLLPLAGAGAAGRAGEMLRRMGEVGATCNCLTTTSRSRVPAGAGCLLHSPQPLPNPHTAKRHLPAPTSCSSLCA